MKIVFALLSASFLLSGHANSVTDYRNRFDGEYELTAKAGTANHFRTTTCTDAVVLSDGTIDARKVECDSETVPQDISQYCPERISVYNNNEIIYLKGMDDLLGERHSIGKGLEDKTEFKSTCKDLKDHGFSGMMGCVLVQTTGFLHEVIKKKSELDEVSYKYKTRETGEHESIVVKKSAEGIVVKRKGLERYAGGKWRNGKREEWNFSCSYKKI